MSLFATYKYNDEFSKEENIKKANRAYLSSYLLGLLVSGLAILGIVFSIIMSKGYTFLIISILLLVAGVYMIVIGLSNLKFVSRLSKNRVFCYTHHYTGLPNMVDNQNVYITADEEKIVFSDNLAKSNFNSTLYLSKIKYTKKFTASELVQASKTKNMILGGILLGFPGAVLGAMVEENNVRPVNLYAITYESNGEEKNVVLKESNHPDFRKLQRFLDDKTPNSSKDVVL